ncbi:neuraminidase-like domain-containing protein [Dactylosporangium sp. CS-047395]|uniref:Tc toxin subunit A-related protein n=1 Tax=Dactylosporangium sp. CS-047395 TaxID=3239936 RepID=UPI003D8BCDC8
MTTADGPVTAHDIALLHDALDAIGIDVDETERAGGQAGPTTRAAVARLHALLGLPAGGDIDRTTIELARGALARLGNGRAVDPGENQSVVEGSVHDGDGAPMAGVTVVALRRGLRDAAELGRAVTDGQGRYSIAYQAEAAVDLQLDVLDAGGTRLFRSEVRHRAGTRAEIVLALGADGRTEPPEAVRVADAVRGLLGPLRPEELAENEQHRDLSYLAEATGFAREHLAFYTVAVRLAGLTALPYELFYALLRQDVPADAEVIVLAATGGGADLDRNAAALLRAVYAARPEVRATAVGHAVREGILAPGYAKRAQADLAKLTTLAGKAALTVPLRTNKTPIGTVLDAAGLPGAKQELFLTLFRGSNDPSEEFWADLATRPEFGATDVATLRFATTVGEATRGHLPLITYLLGRRQAGQFPHTRDLARLDAAGWKAIVLGTGGGPVIGVPPNLTAQDPDQAVEAYTRVLERTFERLHPTTAFSARLAADPAPPLPAKALVTGFLDAQPGFNLLRSDVDRFIKDNPAAVRPADRPAVREALLTGQRVLKLTGRYATARALLADGLHSAQRVYAMGGAAFRQAYGARPEIGPAEADRIFRAAEQTYGLALTVAMNFNGQLAGVSPAAAQQPAPVVGEDFPNVQTLFGSLDLCACEHCRSVLGPSAYLVDLLHFLGQRKIAGGSVKSALLSRRPDLAQIELSCANSGTVLPYLDLVNELLEDAVAPPANPAAAARARQTTLSTDELNAHPEHVNNAAYAKLAGAVFPWGLPFDLPLAEARTYLGLLDTDRPALRRVLTPPAAPGSPASVTTAVETLGMSAVEADIIVAGPLVAGRKPWDHWGLAETGNAVRDPVQTATVVTGGWLEVLARVRILLHRAGLTYRELTRLLNTTFVNPGKAVTITVNPPDSYDLGDMRLTGLTPDFLARLNRFVRLQRRLGWDAYDTDAAIAALQPAAPAGLPRLNPLLLRQLAAVTTAARRFGIRPLAAVALFGRLDTRDVPPVPGEPAPRPSLYRRLFANPAVTNPVDPVFTLDAAGTEIAAIATNPQLADHRPPLLAALELADDELMTAAGAFTDGRLTVAGLSALHRHAVLARGLGLSMGELATMRALAERPAGSAAQPIDPFDPARPEALEEFAAEVDRVRRSGFGIGGLDGLLRGTPAQDGPDDVTIGTLLRSVRAKLAKLRTEAVAGDDPRGEHVRRVLGGLLADAAVTELLRLLAGESPLPEDAQRQLIASALGPFVDVPAVQAALVGSGALRPGKERYEYVLARLDQHTVRDQGTSVVTQELADALGLPTAVVATLVGDWFRAFGDKAQTLLSELLALPDIAREPAAEEQPVTRAEPGFAPYFDAYHRLAKVARVAAGFRLTAADVTWLHPNGVEAGWLDPAALPSTPVAAPEGRYAGWRRLAEAAELRPLLGPGGAVTDLLDLARDGAPKAQYLAVLAERTGWPAENLRVLTGDPAKPDDTGLLNLAYPAQYRSEIALARLAPALAALDRLGVAAGEVAGWLGATVTAAQATSIRQAAKARYPAQQWPEVAKPPRDVLRERQRDALLGWLLANPPAGVSRWYDENDVYARFLIDVAMSAKPATSRIVQASASVQLFVQRCILNLEPGVPVDAGADGDWLQWQWMSRYRVWESNRKVFLYPENWIEPALRRDKSPFFADLENDLLQGEITSGTAEDAFRGYLEKLRAVARLNVVGYYHEPGNPPRMHVVARKPGVPATYYHRMWLDSARWTAWTKIDLDVTGDHVLPQIWRGRLHLFWAVINRKPDHVQPTATMSLSGEEPPATREHYEIKLSYSEFKDGRWSPTETVPQAYVRRSTAISSTHVALRTAQYFDQLHLNVCINGMHRAQFVFQGVGNPVEVYSTDPPDTLAEIDPDTDDIGVLPAERVLATIKRPTNSLRHGMGFVPNLLAPYAANRPRVAPMTALSRNEGVLDSIQVMAKADKYRLVVPHQFHQFDSALPFFYRDPNRQYFLVPIYYYPLGPGSYTTSPPPSGYSYYSYIRYHAFPFYHAFVPLFLRELNAGGVDRLFDRRLQLDPAGVAQTTPFNFLSYYVPNMIIGYMPSEGVDFDSNAGYAIYNWELFFHAPFQIGRALSRNQRFAEAKRWYEYIFNPASTTGGPAPQRYWVTKPFHLAHTADYQNQQIAHLLQLIHDRDPQVEQQVAVWRANPFDPHAIAALRPVAYQRAVVMRYIDNLIDWGDQLFRQDTLEAVNEATQLYVFAADLLGPRLELLPPREDPPAKTYAEIESTLDDFSNVVTAAENLVAPSQSLTPVPAGTPNLPIFRGGYFAIPPNEDLLRYWDVVADRLFKVRNGLNLDGVSRPLALLAPPIDPALLVQAQAAGLDLSSVAGETGGSLPPYRFRVILREAIELAEYVRTLGQELLGVLEKRDADGLDRLRAGAEVDLQRRMTVLQDYAIDEAQHQIDALVRTRAMVSTRQTFYQDRMDTTTNDAEAAAQLLNTEGLVSQVLAGALDVTAGVAHVLPMFQFGASGVGGTPHATAKFGGENVGRAANSWSAVAKTAAAVLQAKAGLAATGAQYARRQDDWRLQFDLATAELAQLDTQDLAAKVRHDIALRNRANHDTVIGNAKAVDEYLHTRYSNGELYEWMIGQTSSTYFQAYQLAYTVARRAERGMRHELGLAQSSFVQFGYWDSLKKGLLAGDRLLHDLRRMEAAFHTDHVRELELTKHVSLVRLDPHALVRLRATGECLVDLPELLFDLDNPGHYQRRLKSVAVSVPCVAGPYAAVPLTLTLLGNHVRVSTDVSPQYARTSAEDPRFADDLGGVATVVTSGGQNDSGLFETRLDDERYLPFERAGAISTWRVRLNPVFPQFDPATISDVVLHVRYTARDAGETLAGPARQTVRTQLNDIALAAGHAGLYQLISARQQYGGAWHRFLYPGERTDQVLDLPVRADDFPIFTRGLDLTATGLDVFAKLTGGSYDLVLTRPGGPELTLTLRADPALGGLHHVGTALAPAVPIGRAPTPEPYPLWTVKVRRTGAPDFRSLDPAEIDDLVLVVRYEVAP